MHADTRTTYITINVLEMRGRCRRRAEEVGLTNTEILHVFSPFLSQAGLVQSFHECMGVMKLTLK